MPLSVSKNKYINENIIKTSTKNKMFPCILVIF